MRTVYKKAESDVRSQSPGEQHSNSKITTQQKIGNTMF